MNALEARNTFPLHEQVAALLARGQPLSAAQLAAATGKSQASISLAIQRLGERVCKMGAARSTRYALTKDILGLPAQQQLIWLGGSAHEFNFGTVTYLANDGLHVRAGGFESLQYNKLPWFLSSLRPQGFIGRELARLRPDLPSDPEQWTVAQVLYVVISHVHDPSGAFVLEGAESGFIPVPNELEKRVAHYDLLTTQVGKGLPAGSSAGGEQPKFVARTMDGQHFIVKYSPPRGTPFGERWHALLHLERLALQVLADHGIATAETALLESTTRTYLQSTRFDHFAEMNRRHVVAAAAVHEQFVGSPQRHWVATCDALEKAKLVTARELSQVASIHAFGHFIGNTDMHFGNLSFFVDDVVKPKISLAPVYDMLPMMWRPSVHDGYLSDSPVREQPLPAGFEHEQTQARAWAIEFWNRAAQLNIGADLQAASLESARRLQNNFSDV